MLATFAIIVASIIAFGLAARIELSARIPIRIGIIEAELSAQMSVVARLSCAVDGSAGQRSGLVLARVP